jgi:hypothetical protein
MNGHWWPVLYISAQRSAKTTALARNPLKICKRLAAQRRLIAVSGHSIHTEAEHGSCFRQEAAAITGRLKD